VAAARPHVAFLGRIPGTEAFGDIARHPENEAIPGLLAFRPEGALLYVNADAVLEAVLARLAAGPPGAVRRVVCDLSAVPRLDLAAATMLRKLHATLAEHGIGLSAVGAHGRVRDLLRRDGVAELLGGLERGTTIATLLAEG
jgi:MFS superfamily sulfate permease-like transporter